MVTKDKDQTTPHHQPLLSSHRITSLSLAASLYVHPLATEVMARVVEAAPVVAITSLERSTVNLHPILAPNDTLKIMLAYNNLGLEEGMLVGCSSLDFAGFFPGYRLRAGSGSSVRRRDEDRIYNSDFDNSGGLSRIRDFSNRKYHGRFQDSSPPYARGRGGGRGFDEPGFGPGPHRGEEMRKKYPNVRPREGDWICTDPLCGHLNFSSGEFCHNCKRPRYRSGGSPRRGYPGPQPPHAPPRRFPGPSLDLSPTWTINGYRSPPQGWARMDPEILGLVAHLPRKGPGSLTMNCREIDLITQMMNWSPRDRGRDSFFHERKGFERQPPSSCWARQNEICILKDVRLWSLYSWYNGSSVFFAG